VYDRAGNEERSSRKYFLADFNLPTYAINITVQNGTVTKTPDKTVYNQDELVTLEAFPDTNYTFNSWLGDLSGSTNPTTIAIDSDKLVTASFVSLDTNRIYALTTNASAEETIIIKTPDKQLYADGEKVELKAVSSDAHFIFNQWKGDLSGSTNPTTITMDSDKFVYADFDAVIFLDTPAVNGATTKIPDKQYYAYQEIVTLEAVPDVGYRFSHWSGNALGSVNPLALTLYRDVSIIANFVPISDDITPPQTTASPKGGIYSSTQNVVLSTNEPATTYYTTNGSIPTTSSGVYSAPIIIDKTTNLRFFSMDTAGNQEAEQSESYAINSSADATVTINGSVEYQTIDGFGVAEAWNIPDSTFYPYLFNDLGVSILRFRMPPGIEPLNDNSDPDVIDWSNIDLSSFNTYYAPAKSGPLSALLKEAKARGVKILGTIWSPPAWMKTNNDTKNGGKVISGYEDEFVEYVVIWVKALKKYYGVDMDYISIQNEPDVTEKWETCRYTGSEINNFIKLVGARFASENITTKIIGPDTGWFGSFASRAGAICADSVTTGYVGTLATHSYGQNFNDPDSLISGWQSIKNLTQSYNKKLWMTEYSKPGGDAYWSTAFNMAQHIHNALAYANVGAYISWEFFDAPEPIIYKDQSTTHRYHTQKQYFRYIRPQAKRVNAQATDSDILVTAFNHKQNKTFTIVVINRTASDKLVDFNISGIQGVSSFNVIRTSVNEDSTDLGSVSVASNFISYGLPAESITTFIGSY
ncbi:MAG TPA: hypothetical protein ENH41_02205, partial [Candidatus Omnitrophica bacterium]|nr:hypothetical protein [Candidatus Omnitrophota bacterium]